MRLRKHNSEKILKKKKYIYIYTSGHFGKNNGKLVPDVERLIDFID